MVAAHIDDPSKINSCTLSVIAVIGAYQEGTDVNGKPSLCIYCTWQMTRQSGDTSLRLIPRHTVK